MTSVAIIGAGPTGISALSVLSQSGLEITLIDPSPTWGTLSPFGDPLGPRCMSFNSSLLSTTRLLHSLEDTISSFKKIDDGLLSSNRLSRTKERPQGWNRGTGQWEHYRYTPENVGEILKGIGGVYMEETECFFNTKVVGIEINDEINDSRKSWKLTLKEVSDDSTYVCTFSHVISCIPAPNLTDLLTPLSSLILPHAFEVISKCSKEYITVYSTLLSIPKESEIFQPLLDKFKDKYCKTQGSSEGRLNSDIVEEIYIEEGDIYLLAVDSLTSSYINIIIHSKSDDSQFCQFFSKYLKTELTENFEIKSKQTFKQSPINEHPIQPLKPLKESACIALSEQPILLASGDWAIGRGCISDALSSGQKGGEMLLKLIDNNDEK